MAIQVGQVAPDFGLFSSDKKKIHLADFRGKNLVILFYPLAFSSVCTEELCNVRDNMNKYSSLNAEVVGISVDTVYTLKKFKEVQNLNFTLLSDFNKEASRAYDSIHETFGYDMRGVSKRSAFVIDSEGVVRYSEVLDNPGEQPDFQKIQEALTGISRQTV